jgi:hypothetical protein
MNAREAREKLDDAGRDLLVLQNARRITEFARPVRTLLSDAESALHFIEDAIEQRAGRTFASIKSDYLNAVRNSRAPTTDLSYLWFFQDTDTPLMSLCGRLRNINDHRQLIKFVERASMSLAASVQITQDWRISWTSYGGRKTPLALVRALYWDSRNPLRAPIEGMVNRLSTQWTRPRVFPEEWSAMFDPLRINTHSTSARNRLSSDEMILCQTKLAVDILRDYLVNVRAVVDKAEQTRILPS